MDLRRSFGAVMATGNNRIRLWVPGYTGAAGDWMAIPPSFPEELRYADATFEVEHDPDQGGFATATYFHQHGCDCSIHMPKEA